jgi:hypothetical protein
MIVYTRVIVVRVDSSDPVIDAKSSLIASDIDTENVTMAHRLYMLCIRPILFVLKSVWLKQGSDAYQRSGCLLDVSLLDGDLCVHD